MDVAFFRRNLFSGDNAWQKLRQGDGLGDLCPDPFSSPDVFDGERQVKIYGMEELEYATRFSLKSLMLARLGVLGLFHGVILLLLFLCIPQGFFPGPKDLMYVLVPYFLTVSIGFSLLRRFRGREVLYISLGVPAFVSLLVAVANQMYPLYSISMVKFWGLAGLFVMIFTVKETILFFRQTEEFVWN